MPLPIIGYVAAVGAPWAIRMLVKYAWGPLVVGLGHLMKTRLGLFIASAAVWLGINFTTINLIIEPSLDLLRGMAAGAGSVGGDFGAAAAGYMGLMQFDRAITMVISAIATKHLLMKGRLYLFRRGVGA